MIISIIACGILAIKLMDHAVAIASAICGSYLFIRGISMFLGGFPSEYSIYTEITAGSYIELPEPFYAYFAAFVLVAIAGVLY